jgi:hypothetical protein
MANAGYSEAVQALMDSMNRFACVKPGQKFRYGPPFAYDDLDAGVDVWARRLNFFRKDSAERTARDLREVCVSYLQELPRCAGQPVYAALQNKMDEVVVGAMNLVRVYEKEAGKAFWSKHMRDSLGMVRPGELPAPGEPSDPCVL